MVVVYIIFNWNHSTNIGGRSWIILTDLIPSVVEVYLFSDKLMSRTWQQMFDYSNIFRFQTMWKLIELLVYSLISCSWSHCVPIINHEKKEKNILFSSSIYFWSLTFDLINEVNRSERRGEWERKKNVIINNSRNYPWDFQSSNQKPLYRILMKSIWSIILRLISVEPNDPLVSMRNKSIELQ